MKKLSLEAEKIMIERFGKDTVVALATVENEVPYVRYVNAYYENGAFYIITYALSNKMKHMENNPTIAIAGIFYFIFCNGNLHGGDLWGEDIPGLADYSADHCGSTGCGYTAYSRRRSCLLYDSAFTA